MFGRILVTAVLLVLLTPLPGRAGPGGALHYNKDYLMLLIAFPYPWPEFVQLHLSDNGTFSLKSDFYAEPARGTYEKQSFLVRGRGTTATFFDPDYDEEITLSYDFVTLSMGLRNFFLLGTGLRLIRYFSDNQTTSENFILQGPGFSRLPH